MTSHWPCQSATSQLHAPCAPNDVLVLSEQRDGLRIEFQHASRYDAYAPTVVIARADIPALIDAMKKLAAQ